METKTEYSVILVEKDSETNEFILSIDEPNWAIMVSAPTEKEGWEKFDRAFRATLVVKSMLSIRNSLLSIRTISDRIKEDILKNKKRIDNQDFATC